MRGKTVRLSASAFWVAIGFIMCAVMLAVVDVSAGAPGPGQIVERYCNLDLKGARLHSDGIAAVQDMVTWPDEPGWDGIVVVSGFKRGTPIESGGQTVIPVTYDVAGFLNGWQWTSANSSEGKTQLDEEQKKDFLLVQESGKWKITKPVFPPHVDVKTALEHCRAAWPDYESGSNTDGQKEALARTIKILEKLTRAK